MHLLGDAVRRMAKTIRHLLDAALSRSVVTSSVHSVLASLTLFTMHARFDWHGFDAVCSDEQVAGKNVLGRCGVESRE